MKKSIIIISIAAVICSCSKEQTYGLLNSDPTSGMVSFSATFEGARDLDTKIALNTSNGDLTWVDGDAIAVEMTDHTFKSFVFSAETKKFTADLGGKSVLDKGVAYYPATIAIDGTPDSVNLPAEYAASYTKSGDDTYAIVKSPMVATVNLGATMLSLKHLGGILSIDVSRVPSDATKLVLTATGKDIAGEFAVSNGQIEAGSTGINNSITLTFSAGTFSSATEFFIPVPVTTFSGGFTVAFKNSATTPETLYTHSTNTSTTPISITRKSITRMAQLTVPVSVYINTSSIWWSDTNQYIHVVKSDDANTYYAAWPGTQFAINSTKSFTHGSKKYYRVIEDLGATMTGKTANIIIHRGASTTNNSNWPESDLCRATLYSINLTGDVYISLTSSSSSSHRIFVSNWGNNASFNQIKVWNGKADTYSWISDLATATLGDHSYHYFTTTDSEIWIRGKAIYESQWETNDSDISIATGWEYFVKFVSENNNNTSSYYGFPAVVITKD